MSGSTDSQEAADFPLASDSDLASGAVKFVGIKPAAVEGATAPAEGYTADLAQIVSAVLPKAVPVLQAGAAATLPPGSEMAFSVDVTDPAAPKLNISLPTGPQGEDGEIGATPRISATVTGLDAGAAPTVTVSGDPATPQLAFALPKGDKGEDSTVPGPAGPPVIQQLLQMLGGWNAATNATNNSAQPTLASGTGTANTGYYVTTAGTTALDGVTAWAANDVAAFVNGKWLKLTGYAAAAAVTALSVVSSFSVGGISYQQGGLYPFSWLDGNGNIAGYIDAKAKFVFGTLQVIGSAEIGSLTLDTLTLDQYSLGADVVLSESGADGWFYKIKDENGFIVAGIQADSDGDPVWVDNGTGGSGGGGGGSTTSYAQEEIDYRDALAVARASLVASLPDTVSAAPIWNYNHVLLYGQSLSDGWQGWPALSIIPKYDSVMFGGAVRPLSEQGTTWLPVVTGTTFSPLVECTQPVGANGAIMAPADVAALAVTASNMGETVASGAVNFFRKMQLLTSALASNILVASSCGVGGMTIAELSKGATPELFNRLRTCASQVQAAAVAEGKTYGILAMLYLQGEADYNGVTTYQDYYDALAQLRSDFEADVVTGIAGQSLMPAVFTYQTGESFTKESMAVGQAQLQFALDHADQGWYMAAPVYPVTDKGGHLDPNGYRWMGCQFGKVMHRVLNLRQRWLPLHPTRLTGRGLYALLNLHVPCPPIVFDTPWVGGTSGTGVLQKATLSNQGFSAFDDAGVLPIASVEIVGDASILFTFGRARSTNAYLLHADATYNHGNGGVRDSDDTRADDVYAYTAGNGQYPAADLPELNGEPYPLWNWLVAFSMPITDD